MISKDSIESAYCFFHQKLRVYQYSKLGWQKDDIELAISDYVEEMDKDLYNQLAEGKTEFLLDHETFESDLTRAVNSLEKMMK